MPHTHATDNLDILSSITVRMVDVQPPKVQTFLVDKIPLCTFKHLQNWFG
jgi:hypothetical protein